MTGGPWTRSMDPVHENGPWTRSKEGVHGPLVHVFSSPGYKMAAFVISFQRSLSIFLWWIKTWAKVCWNGNKWKQSSDDKEINTASETSAFTKKTMQLGGVEGKYKWLRFEGEKQNGNKMFCEFCREFTKRKNLQYSRGSDQIISKQTAWKHIHVSWGQWRTCFGQCSRTWNFFF